MGPLDELFPADVLTALSSTVPHDCNLYPEEADYVRGCAERRREEFSIGRCLGRQVLAEFGIHNFPLVPGSTRAPVWPRGVVGSISHSEQLCGVAVARRGVIVNLGLDLELSRPFPVEVIERVCVPDEISWVQSVAPPETGDWFLHFFSAKESVYKALHPITGEVLDFSDVEVTFHPEDHAFTVASIKNGKPGSENTIRLHGRFVSLQSHIATGVTARWGNS